MLCMMVCATVMFAGCNKDENNEPTPAANGGGSNGGNDTGEGIYLGIIGFNRDLYKKDISLLNNNNVQSYYNFINSMDTLNYTALYWADFSALKMMKTFPEPPKLKNVILVTFSDGLDNVSRNAAFNPEGYPSKEAYRNAIQEKILNEQIHGHNVSAYTIGLKGSDVGADEEDEFMDNLRKLASSDENVFLVSNMNEALEKFSQIANELYSISTSVNLNIEIPGGYDDGQRLRITLDHASSAEASNRYIEGSFRITSDGCVLENVSYHGLAAGSTSVSSSSYDGVAYGFVFVDLKQTSGEPLTANDLNKNNIMLWKKGNSGTWSTESEFDQDRSSSVSEDKNSALIMLTLDCSSSMGSDFGNMKNASNHFIATLANSNSNGGGNTTPDGYVDLGLPSGLLWAKCNLGANSPEQYGDYYAWGEITTKNTYNWSTYRYCNGSWNTMTKYCKDSYYGNNGFTDNLTTLQAMDDAATQKLGSGARMPTADEWRELVNNTTAEWMQMYGVYGLRFTSSNGNSIFLPAAGYRDSELRNAGVKGRYWSSSLGVVGSDAASDFNVSVDRTYMYSSGTNRYYGQSVRAVRSQN